MINARAETVAEQARLPRRADDAALPDRRRRLLRVAAAADAGGAQAAVAHHPGRRRAVRVRRPVGHLARPATRTRRCAAARSSRPTRTSALRRHPRPDAGDAARPGRRGGVAATTTRRRELLHELLVPLPDELIARRAVGPAVSDARYDGPECLDDADPRTAPTPPAPTAVLKRPARSAASVGRVELTTPRLRLRPARARRDARPARRPAGRRPALGRRLSAGRRRSSRSRCRRARRAAASTAGALRPLPGAAARRRRRRSSSATSASTRRPTSSARCSIGFAIVPAARRRGYATEALRDAAGLGAAPARGPRRARRHRPRQPRLPAGAARRRRCGIADEGDRKVYEIHAA